MSQNRYIKFGYTPIWPRNISFKFNNMLTGPKSITLYSVISHLGQRVTKIQLWNKITKYVFQRIGNLPYKTIEYILYYFI